MDLEKFIEKRPYLYHLTSQTNADNIIEGRKLLSTNELISLSGAESNEKIKRERRLSHVPLKVNGVEILLRDQRPISEKALGKCLSDNWNVGDFLNHLNDRVFMWPTLDRLWRHYNRYANEGPIIFRFSTQDIFELNPHVKFCRLNSGATRANSHLGGKAPERGPNTFLSSTKFDFPIGSVAEVTFEGKCNLSENFSYGEIPDGNYVHVTNWRK